MGAVNILNSLIFVFIIMIYFLENKGVFGSSDDSSNERDISSSKNKNSSDKSENFDIKNSNTSKPPHKLGRVLSKIVEKSRKTCTGIGHSSEKLKKLSIGGNSGNFESSSKPSTRNSDTFEPSKNLNMGNLRISEPPTEPKNFKSTKLLGNSKKTGADTSKQTNKFSSKNKNSFIESDDDSGSSDESGINKNLLKKFNNVGFKSKHSTMKSDDNSHDPVFLDDLITKHPLKNNKNIDIGRNSDFSAPPSRPKGPMTINFTQNPKNFGIVRTDNPESSNRLYGPTITKNLLNDFNSVGSTSKNSSKEFDADSDNSDDLMTNRGPSKNYKNIGIGNVGTSAQPSKPRGPRTLNSLQKQKGIGIKNSDTIRPPTRMMTSKGKGIAEESDDDSDSSDDHKTNRNPLKNYNNVGTRKAGNSESSNKPKNPMTRDLLGKQKQSGIGSSGTSDILNKPKGAMTVNSLDETKNIGPGNAAATEPNNMLIPWNSYMPTSTTSDQLDPGTQDYYGGYPSNYPPSNAYPQGLPYYPDSGAQDYYGGYPTNYQPSNAYPQGLSYYPNSEAQDYYGGYPTNYSSSNAYPQEPYNYPYPGTQDYYYGGYPSYGYNSYPIHHFVHEYHSESSNVPTTTDTIVESLDCSNWEQEPIICKEINRGRQLCKKLANNIIPNSTLTYIDNSFHCTNAYVRLRPAYPREHCKVLQCSYFGENFYITTDSSEKRVHILQFSSIVNVNSEPLLDLKYYKSLSADVEMFKS